MTVLAKFNCNEILIQAKDGRLFVADVHHLDRMKPVEDSPPGEPDAEIVPFKPRKSWRFHAKPLEFFTPSRQAFEPGSRFAESAG